MQDPLKLGFFIQPVHPPDRPYADVLREDREAVILADRLDYHEAFIGEHLVDSAETITSSLAFIANLADTCPSITFGTGVLPLANYHPAMAAAQVAMVDHLVQGRLVLGVGPGVPGDAEAIGNLGSDRNRKTQEALDHIRRIWNEEPPYRIEGEFYRTITERSFDRRIGVGVAVAWHLCGCLTVAQLRRRARPADAELRAEVARAALHLGVPAPRVQTHDRELSPMITGWRHPVLLLPRALWRRLDNCKDINFSHDL